jgi:hypothetical protein
MTDSEKQAGFNQKMRQRQGEAEHKSSESARPVSSRQSKPVSAEGLENPPDSSGAPRAGSGPNEAVEPRPSAQPGAAGSAGRARARWSRRGLIGVASLAVAGVLMSGLGLFGAGDSVSPQEVADRQAAYELLLAGPGMPLRMVASEDVEAAIAAMPDTVSEAEREQVRAEVASGAVRLAWLTVWDTHVEDGDVLRFESSVSIPIEIMALNAKTTFGVPFPPDGMVRVTGVRDGGGGITVGLESGETRILWPTMQPGDVLDLPVRPAF